MKILLANPRGFCAGVRRAINIVKKALEVYGTPIYVHHEIVHNRYVVNDLRRHGVVFIEKLDEVPNGSILVFSAHGVSKKVRDEAYSRKLIVLDATCPLVAKVHSEVARASHSGKEVILIGHAGHPEVEGTLGQYDNQQGGIYLVESPQDVLKLNLKNKMKVSLVTQTTLLADDVFEIIKALHTRFPKIINIRKNYNICYATINRQEAVASLAKEVDIVLVVGSNNSSNANRLVEKVKQLGKSVFLIDDASDIQESWLEGVMRLGVTAGASVPENLVKNVVIRLKIFGAKEIASILGKKEKIIFKMPKFHSVL